MRRRILFAILGTTALASLVLTIPLAVVAARREHEQSVSELDLDAQQALIEITRNGGFDPERVTLHDEEWNAEIGVYLPDGRRVAGEGPATADEVTRSAVFMTTNERVDNRVVVAQPIVANGDKLATIRVAEVLPETQGRIRRSLLFLAAFDAAAVGFAGIVGVALSAHLARPVSRLRDDAVRLGDGDFSITARRSGIGEIDETAVALSDTARRLGETLRREREFTVNASHQLRTPLTSLRVLLEAEMESPRPSPRDAVEDALGDVDRLQTTLDTMLDVARGAPTTRTALDIDSWAVDASERWNSRLDQAPIVMDCDVSATLHVSRPVLDQIADILVTNARQHGCGNVTVAIREQAGRLVLTIGDQGRLDRNPAELFERHDPNAAGYGVGLSLARSLAVAEGGRLVVQDVDPTTFRLWLPSHSAVAANP